MGNSRQTSVRKLAMQVLYQFESHAQDDLDAQAKLYLSYSETEVRTQEMALPLALDAWAFSKQADEIIQTHALNWKVERLNRVDHAIMRLALYELVVLEKPKQIVIDEAVNLAKRFSGSEAAKFINGILGAHAGNITHV